MRKTHKPKFKIGDRVCFASHVPHMVRRGFHGDDVLHVIDRSVKARATDPRQNRYEVSRSIGSSLIVGTPLTGWFYEDDLELA